MVITDRCMISIHYCSGGCGRTGTYIALCLLIDCLKAEGVVDIFQTVRSLRMQRIGMIRSVVSNEMFPCRIGYYN